MDVEGGNLDFKGTIDGELDLKLPRFDYVICTEVLEHVLDWKKTSQNFQQLTKPGGEILITAPFLYPLHEEPFTSATLPF